MEINQIRLLSNDLVSTERFYNQILDMATVYKTEQEIIFSAGKSKIIFVKSETQNPNYHIAFDIPTNKLNEAFKSLKKKISILPISGENYISDIKHWNAKSFYFYDNNNNLLELIARFDNLNESEALFNGKSILYVSEIGIVTENAPELATQLMKKYGLQYYLKQDPLVDFIALGNDQGLFIIVDQNRAWYPTTRKAQMFSVSVKFSLSDDLITEFVMDV